jgi:Acetyltransferases
MYGQHIKMCKLSSYVLVMLAAYYNDIVVGAVCCRIDTSENSRRLYIMTLGCLYPYRRLGIGSKMVEHVLKYVNTDGNFDSIFL